MWVLSPTREGLSQTFPICGRHSHQLLIIGQLEVVSNEVAAGDVRGRQDQGKILKEIPSVLPSALDYSLHVCVTISRWVLVLPSELALFCALPSCLPGMGSPSLAIMSGPTQDGTSF